MKMIVFRFLQRAETITIVLNIYDFIYLLFV